MMTLNLTAREQRQLVYMVRERCRCLRDELKHSPYKGDKPALTKALASYRILLKKLETKGK